MIRVLLLVLVLTIKLTVISATEAIKFDVVLPDGNEVVYSFNRSNHEGCIYTSQPSKVTCMTKQTYKEVQNKWKHNAIDIQYLAVNCMKDDYSSKHSICTCINGSDTNNRGKSLQHDVTYNCHLRSLSEGMFAKLSQLKVLDLSYNSISRIEKDTFAGLRTLSYLDLSYNQINFLQEGFLCDLPNVEILRMVKINLDGGKFNRKLFHCGVDLQKLTFIDLSENKIDNMPNQIFENMPNVRTLILRNNKIKYISESAFFGASQLRYLDISLNFLPALPRAFCDFLYQIKIVNISTNRLTNLNLNDISNCDTAEVVDISRNMIHTLKGTLLQHSDMIVFNVSGNGLTGISDNFLYNASKVNTIDLSFNKLHTLSSTAFNNMASLRELKLNGNKFNDTINFMKVFKTANQLEHLDISSNIISNIMNGTFEELKHLKILDLSKNKISEVYSESFKGLVSVQRLMLNYNTMLDINETSLSHLTSLTDVDLSHNMLNNDIDKLEIPVSLIRVSLEENIMSHFPTCFAGSSIKELNIRSNVITDMLQNTTMGLFNLETLDLSFNQLTSLENASFVDMTSLTDLNLSFNDISDTLSRDIFNGMTNLTNLNLQKNFFTGLDGFFSFPSTTTITHLDLSYNTIEQIHALITRDKTNQSDHMLRELNFEHGYVREVSQNAFEGFLNLRQVNLKNNMIKTIQPFKIAYKTEFLLQNNPLECSCTMSWLSESYVDVLGRPVSTYDYEVDKCIVRPDGLELPVRKVPRNQFRCKVNNSCDSLCDCFSFKDGIKIDYVRCRGLIGNMPETLSRDAKIMYLDGNRIPMLRIPQHYSADFLTTELYLNNSQINMIEDIFFSGFQLIRILDLSNNEISSLSSAIFSNLLNLEELNLSENNLNVISPSWFDSLSLKVLYLNSNKIKHANQTFLTRMGSMHSLQFIQLKDNPWKCDCENRYFRIWLKKFGKNVQQKYNIECVGTKRPLLSYHVSEFKCTSSERHVNKRGIVTLLIVLSVCFVLLSAASFYYRRDILAISYIKLGIGCLRHKYNAHKPYDAYLVYDANDTKCSDWVNFSLLIFLEKRKNPYKIVTVDKNKLISSVADVNNIQLEESKCCLFILNNTVMSNSWCVESFHKAWSYSRKHPKFKIIIIVFGDLELNLLEQEMRFMLSEGQYITARSRSVWDRLIYELPNPEKGINSLRSDDDVSENDVIIYSAASNSEEYGSVSIH